MRARSLLARSMALAVVAAGCGRLGYGAASDGGPVPDAQVADGGGTARDDGGSATGDAAGPDDAGVTELCNGLDDDGDTRIDEGIDVTTDPLNCGACGVVCTFAHANARCEASVCTLGGCRDTWRNCNMSAADGCELDISSDPDNCGQCARTCSPTPTCAESHCPEDVVQLAAGGDFSCGRTVAGEVWCWGGNADGELGDGTTTDRLTAVRAAVMGAREVSAGYAHACAATGLDLRCWGANGSGQLGDGTTTGSPMPVAVALPPGLAVRSVGAGRAHTCAVLEDGSVWCWGENLAGQLGDGTTTSRPTAAPVSGLTGAATVSAGDSHTCALMAADGTERCWGDNAFGQLGDGTVTDSPTPVVVFGLSEQAHIEVGAFHSLSHGSAWGWGRNDEGQLGDGTAALRTTPAAILVSDHALVAGGDAHSCVLVPPGGVACAGRNTNGQLGDGTTTAASTPVTVMMVGATVHIATGAAHSCAVNTVGVVKCWGANASGQLGDGTRVDRPVAVRARGLP